MCSGGLLSFLGSSRGIQAIQFLINIFLRACQGSFCESNIYALSSVCWTPCLNRFICGQHNLISVTTFEATLFPPFTQILQGDIDRTYPLSCYFSTRKAIKLSAIEYIPYVFQILAQMLILHRGVPADYRTLLPFLLTPAIWAPEGLRPWTRLAVAGVPFT